MNAPADAIALVALDLDGTLIDSAPDLATAVNHALAGIDLPMLAEERIIGMIGDGIHTLVERALTASLEHTPTAALLSTTAAQAVGYYREALFVHSRVYAGVREGLAALRERGVMLCCVTNKVSDLTLPLLAASGLAPSLEHVLCADTPGERKPAPALLMRACAATGVAPRNVLMVGDSPVDIAAGRAAGTRVAAVSYGYTPADRLRVLGPDWLVTSIADIPGLLHQSA